MWRDESTVLFSQEDNGGIVYHMAEAASNAGFSLIVIDSSDSLFTSAEEEGDYAMHTWGNGTSNSQALKS